MGMSHTCCSKSTDTCGATQANPSVIWCCRPLKKSCLCDGNTCTNSHVNDCASHRNCMMECSACITRHIRSSSGSLTVQTPARITDPSWSSSQTSPRAAQARRTCMKVACFCCRMRRLSGDRSRWLREQPLAKHSCAGLPRPPLQSVGLFTVI